MTAVLLALLTALTYGVANYLGPLLTRTNPLAAVLLVGQVVGVVGAAALLLLTGGEPPDRRHLVLGLLAGASNGVALAAIYTAAARGPMSVVIPIGATGAVVPVAVALATGERPGPVQLLGIPLAVVGVVAAAAREGTGEHAALGTVALALLSALGFGTFLTLFGAASDDGTSWGLFTSRVSLVVCTAAVVSLRRMPVRVPRDRVAPMALPGLLLFIGTAAYGVATTEGLVSVVAVLATLAPVVTVGLAVVLLGERLARRQRAGVAVALLGVVLLAAG